MKSSFFPQFGKKVKDFSCSFTNFLNKLKSLVTVVVQSFRLFHGVDALYVTEFLSISVWGRGSISLLLSLNE